MGVVRSLAVERGADAAHDVGAEGGLRIERGFDAENVAGGEIDELRGDGGGAEIDGDAEAAFFAWFWSEVTAGATAESARISMCHWPHSRTSGASVGRLAGETPSGGELIGSERWCGRHR